MKRLLILILLLNVLVVTGTLVSADVQTIATGRSLGARHAPVAIITTTVMSGKVTLLGTVKTEALKVQVEKMVKQTKGVKEVDNQITVVAD